MSGGVSPRSRRCCFSGSEQQRRVQRAPGQSAATLGERRVCSRGEHIPRQVRRDSLQRLLQRDATFSALTSGHAPIRLRSTEPKVTGSNPVGRASQMPRYRGAFVVLRRASCLLVDQVATKVATRPLSEERRLRRRTNSCVAASCAVARVPSVADCGRGTVKARVVRLGEEEARDVGAGDARADAVAPRYPARTEPMAAPSVGRVKRAIVQSRGLSVISCDMASSSR